MALAVAGCTTAKEEPPPAPSTEAAAPSPAPVLTTEPEPEPEPVTAPERPPAMDSPDEAGAIAAAEYVMQSYAYALSSGDLTAWDELSGQSCAFCENTREEVMRVYSAGGSYRGGELRELFDTKVVGRDDQLGVYGVQVGFEIDGGSEYDASGSVLDEFPPERAFILVELVPSARGWVLVGGSALDGPLP